MSSCYIPPGLTSLGPLRQTVGKVNEDMEKYCNGGEVRSHQPEADLKKNRKRKQEQQKSKAEKKGKRKEARERKEHEKGKNSQETDSAGALSSLRRRASHSPPAREPAHENEAMFLLLSLALTIPPGQSLVR